VTTHKVVAPVASRKAPVAFADEQAVDVYERKSKQARREVFDVEDAVPVLISDDEEEKAVDSDTDADVPAHDVSDDTLDDDPDVNPAHPESDDESFDSIWREELEEVDIGVFKGRMEPEEVSLSVSLIFCNFVFISLTSFNVCSLSCV
jgi:hypothetical protein